MNQRLGIIAAMPREVAGMIRGWRRERSRPGVDVFVSDSAVVVCGGMGAGRATLAVEAALSVGVAKQLISVGFAGACEPSLRVGAVVEVEVVVDVRTGERYESTGDTSKRESSVGCVLATVDGVSSVVEKRRLWTSYGASVVDMEAATVARMAEMRGLEFRAIKVVSDEASFELGDMSRFTTKEGRMREAAFAAHMISRPSRWKTLGQLARNARVAEGALSRELAQVVERAKEEG